MIRVKTGRTDIVLMIFSSLPNRRNICEELLPEFQDEFDKKLEEGCE